MFIAAFVIACLRNPIWALYLAIFLSFLPRQLELMLPNYSILLALLLALLSWILNAAFQRRRIVLASTILLMGCFLVWGVITLIWAPDLVLGRRQLVAYAIGFLFLLLLVNEVNSLKSLDGLMKTLALSGWVLVLTGLGSVLIQGYQSETQLEVLETNANVYGILIPIAMIGTLWQAMYPSQRHNRLGMALSAVFILLAIILIALSGSRGSALTLLTILLLFWFWKPTRPWGKLGLLIIVVVAVSAPLIFLTTFERFVEQAGGILGGRLLIWKAAWQLIKENPWGGVGIGNASTVLGSYVRFARPVWEERIAIHNPPLAIWIESGLPGLLLYLGILGSALWRFLREYFRCKSRGLLFLSPYFALVSSVSVGYMLSWIKGGGIEVHFTYFLMLALLLIPYRMSSGEAVGWMERGIREASMGKP